jgi:asparagine synthase (glutamine-hydrolysing)
MSGIAGLYYRDGRPVDPEQLTAMGTALAHRGPDGISYYYRGSVGLVHCMLYDTPESLLEKLPNRSEDEQYIVTFHGRIDNRQDLYDRIGWNRPLSAVTDSDLVLAAYRKWRNRCVDFLLGDFAFALWDQTQRNMFCARDHMGVKPFYYYLSDTLFAFASEIKGLLALSEIPRVLNKERLADFLVCVVLNKESTFYENILRLPPSHFLEVQLGKTNKCCYHELKAKKLFCKDSSEYEAAFRELFIEAVRCRLRSAFPVGSFLSGGLDSASIVCVAAGMLTNELPESLHTFSGVFDKIASCDERKYFQSIIGEFNITAHYLTVDNVSPSEIFEKIVSQEDEPFWAPHIFMGMNLMWMAKREGVRVLLDGHDGDAAVSYGYRLFSELAASGNILQLISEYRKAGHTKIRRLMKDILLTYRDVFFAIFPRAGYYLSGRKSINDDLQILHPEFTRKTDIRNRLCSHYRNFPQPGLSEMDYHERDLNQPIHPYALDFFDRLGSHSSISIRFPFFDKRILEFCLGVPSKEKFVKGKNRNIVRNALADILHKDIRERKTKTDFTPSLLEGYTIRDGEWLDLSIDSISEKSYHFLNKRFCSVARSKLMGSGSKGQQIYLSKMLAAISFSRWMEYLGKSLISFR